MIKDQEEKIHLFTGGRGYGKTLAMYNMMLSMDYEYRNTRNGKDVIDVEPTEINGKRLITAGDKID